MLVGVLYLLGLASEILERWADALRFYERVFAVDIQFRDIGDRLAAVERLGLDERGSFGALPAHAYAE
jgi:hypothetical protein